MKDAIIFFTIVFSLLFCSCIYSIFKLIKLYRNKSEKNQLKAAWKSILYRLLIAPAIFYTLSSGEAPVPNSESAFAMDLYFGEKAGGFIGAYLTYLFFTYLISSIISISKKDISAHTLGFCITIFWLPVNVGLIVAFSNIVIKSEIKSSNLIQLASCGKNEMKNFNMIFYKKYGFDVVAITNPNDFDSIFGENAIWSLNKIKKSKKDFVTKVDNLKKLHTWWKTKYETLIEDTAFDDIVIELLSKCNAWHNIDNEGQKKFISDAKKGMEIQNNKIIKIMKKYDISSPFEFKLAYYSKAIEIFDLYIASFKALTEQESSKFQSDIDYNMSILGDLIKEEQNFMIDILKKEDKEKIKFRRPTFFNNL